MTRLQLPEYKYVPPMAQFLESTHNYGVDRGLRLGLKNSNGDIILMMDAGYSHRA